MIGLRDKVVLITGASRGIGRAAAEIFGRYGARVAINYHHHAEAAAEVLAAVEAAGGEGMLAGADVSEAAAVREMVAAIVAKWGRIDVLVNNAGVWLPAPIDRFPLETYRRTLAINLDGVIFCTEAVVPLMIRQGGGRIINISSTAGQRGEPVYSPYAASKGAVISLTKSHAVELARHNIQVNSVAPGWVDTEMSAAAIANEQETILRTIPMRRPGRAEEIAWPIVFLASDGASYITGEIFNINGGSVLCG
ncbi:MAG TPA: 3-oxoacyl-ACP reductase family protein [bacterium]|nr:3-oxoacyl-ACP reductase family protein [bacterium]HPR88404.1 3-oxoacyl-ACP reductase family protein [bacterium]